MVEMNRERGEDGRDLGVGDLRLSHCAKMNMWFWLATVLYSYNFSELSLSASNDYILWLSLLTDQIPTHKAILYCPTYLLLHKPLSKSKYGPHQCQILSHTECETPYFRPLKVLWICWRMKLVARWESKEAFWLSFLLTCVCDWFFF